MFKLLFKKLTMPSLCQALQSAVLLLTLFVAWPVLAAQQVVATRVWPAEDYTRITLESNTPFQFSMQKIRHPDRIVLDIEGVVLNSQLKAVASKVSLSDPFIKNVRLAYFKPNVVRLVVDLKSDVKPHAFSLKPAGNYKHRLVLDIYPLQDSLMAMLEEYDAKNAKGQAIKVIGVAKKQASKYATKRVQTQKKSSHPKTALRMISRELVIAIDAGHGGEDPGASGATGSREKDITLKIAKRLKAVIDKEPNMRGELIRKGDYYVPLRARVAKARKLQADLFISIHADAFKKETARGSSVFVLSERGASSEGARFLAQKENESDLIGGVSLDDKDPVLAKILLDLSQTAMIHDSLKVANAVLGQIGKINKLHKKHVEHAGFAVLKSPDIPSILVETAFISNRSEERKLRKPAYQQKFAKSILKGIKTYFASNPALANIPESAVYAKE